MRELSIEQKGEFKDILETLGESLDITKTQFDNLTRSYRAVGEFLENDPTFIAYNPLVTPQGSLRLGTIIKPVSPSDDLDVDLVYRLSDKYYSWTQKNIKEKVGFRLKDSDRYSPMLQNDEGRRCWTLLYRDNSDNPLEKYHMDILPAVADSKYSERLLRLYSQNYSDLTIDQISIRITDTQSNNYETSIQANEWLKSNPDGYALWFANRCKSGVSLKMLMEQVVPFDNYNTNKTVLQRIVQILKRHRDMMFYTDNEDKPISIIITTLAARAYSGESNLVDGLANVVGNMEKGISKGMNEEDWIGNPVNPEENFADKWPTHPKRRENFYKWLNAVKKDVADIFEGSNHTEINSNIGRIFGQDAAKTAASLLAERRKSSITAGATLLSSSGVVGAVGKKLNAANTFYGKS